VISVLSGVSPDRKPGNKLTGNIALQEAVRLNNQMTTTTSPSIEIPLGKKVHQVKPCPVKHIKVNKTS
jgi:hypothetical protein